MTFAYHIRRSSLPTIVARQGAALIDSIDMTPCTYYYGTLYTKRALTDEEMGDADLVPADEESMEDARERNALYNAEMRLGA